jgi:hypothetical protein
MRGEYAGLRIEHVAQRVAEPGEQGARAVEHVAAAAAGAEQQRDQFRVGQRRRPAFEQPLARQVRLPVPRAPLARPLDGDPVGRSGRGSARSRHSVAGAATQDEGMFETPMAAGAGATSSHFQPCARR